MNSGVFTESRKENRQMAIAIERAVSYFIKITIRIAPVHIDKKTYLKIR
jgi:hypothetical protein